MKSETCNEGDAVAAAVHILGQVVSRETSSDTSVLFQRQLQSLMYMYWLSNSEKERGMAVA